MLALRLEDELAVKNTGSVAEHEGELARCLREVSPVEWGVAACKLGLAVLKGNWQCDEAADRARELFRAAAEAIEPSGEPQLWVRCLLWLCTMNKRAGLHAEAASELHRVIEQGVISASTHPEEWYEVQQGLGDCYLRQDGSAGVAEEKYRAALKAAGRLKGSQKTKRKVGFAMLGVGEAIWLSEGEAGARARLREAEEILEKGIEVVSEGGMIGTQIGYPTLRKVQAVLARQGSVAGEFDNPREDVLPTEGATDEGTVPNEDGTSRKPSELREEFVPASLGALKSRLVPTITDRDIEQLEELIRGAQRNPPEDRAAFVEDMNAILDATGTRILADGESLARLRLLPSGVRGSIQLGVSGGTRGFRGAQIRVVRLEDHGPAPAAGPL